MTESAFSVDELRVLADAACNGMLAEPDLARLESLLYDNVEAQRFYLKRVSFDTWLGCTLAGAGREPIAAPAVETEAEPNFLLAPSLLSGAVPTTTGVFSSGWPLAYLVATVIFGVVLLIGSLVPAFHPKQIDTGSPQIATGNAASLPRTEPVGRITGMVDCRWEGSGDRGQGAGDSGRKPSGHSSLSTTHYPRSTVCLGDTLALKSGLLELTYDTGARVILQGPVTYKVDSAAGGYLVIGKLTAKLEKRGQRAGDREQSMASGPSSSNRSSLSTDHYPLSTVPNPSPAPRPSSPAPTFAVRTPTALVTDLGTEFGVEVDQQGATTSRVYRGLVRVDVLTDSGELEGDGQVLRENESLRVDPKSQRRMAVVPASKSPDFVRQIAKPTIKTFDLVDAVAGGDGFSGRRNASIDPISGRRSTETFIRTAYTAASPQCRGVGEDVWAVGDGKFHPALGLPFVDGVFIPDGSKGPITVDSAGHVFADCPETLNVAPHLIWAGGAIPSLPKLVVATTINGVDYAQNGHGLLWMHANLGITFDLDAIRKANPGWIVRRFSAVVANMESLSKDGKEAWADYWVLVDGRSLGHSRRINSNGAIPITVMIKSSDRFLTLISTDGNNDLNQDLIAFGDPRLELIEKKARQASKESTVKGGP